MQYLPSANHGLWPSLALSMPGGHLHRQDICIVEHNDVQNVNSAESCRLIRGSTKHICDTIRTSQHTVLFGPQTHRGIDLEKYSCAPEMIRRIFLAVVCTGWLTNKRHEGSHNCRLSSLILSFLKLCGCFSRNPTSVGVNFVGAKCYSKFSAALNEIIAQYLVCAAADMTNML